MTELETRLELVKDDNTVPFIGIRASPCKSDKNSLDDSTGSSLQRSQSDAYDNVSLMYRQSSQTR